MSSPSSSSSSAWSKTKTTSKATFDKGWNLFEKLGGPVNKITNKIGSEAFWPTSLDKESEKAARILKSFCKDGVYKDVEPENRDEVKAAQRVDGPKGKAKVLVKIPKKVIQNCVGLAIFTAWRTGWGISAASGSGVLVAKGVDGKWSAPSGLLIHTLGFGFLAGIDIYDCIIVINTPAALSAFTRVRLTLGAELSAVAGPVGIGGNLEAELVKNSKKPLFTYMKSRGLYGGAQIDGTVIVERNDENERFYGKKVSAKDILSWRMEETVQTRVLREALEGAEGRREGFGVVEEVSGGMGTSDAVGAPLVEQESGYHVTENPPEYSPPAGPPPGRDQVSGTTDVKYS